MNIFYLDHNPTIAALYHCDKHVVKMVLETAQILSTVQRLSGNDDQILYKCTHINHPCIKWANEEIGNYKWLSELGINLLAEYSYRYNKQHKCTELLSYLSKVIPAKVKLITKPPLCMPDQYKQDDPVEAYRAYYRGEKKRFAKYTNRPYPEWLK